MTTTIDGDNINYNLVNLTDADSTYQGEGEELFTVDTSSGTLTVELRDNDTVAGFHKRFFDIGSNIETNAVTFNTQSSQNIDGGSSITWDHNNGSYIDLWSDGSNWFTSLQDAADSLVADTFTSNTSITDANGNTIADFTGSNLSVDGSNNLNAAQGVDTNVVSSNYTTSDEDLIIVDESGGAVTVTLSDSDTSNGNTIGVINLTGSNTVTVDTQSSQTIDPNSESSKTITKGGWRIDFSSDGTNWDASLASEFENIGLANVTGDGLPAQALEHGKVWADDGQLYDSVGTADSNATNYLIIGPGTFNESVSLDTTHVRGAGRDTLIDGGSSDAITVNSGCETVENLAVQTTAGGGNTARGIDVGVDAVTLNQIWVEESDQNGIQINSGSDTKVLNVFCDSANIDGTDINLGGSTSGCLVDDIVGSVTDSGTGNTVGETV